MNNGKNYQTKQRACIYEVISSHADTYVTIQQICEELEACGHKVGLTTIYRNLDRLEKEQLIAKVSISGISGCCYKLLSKEEAEKHFYLKCEDCGSMVPLECKELEHLYEHLSEDHHIRINPCKTMFYGKCEHCECEELG